MAVMAPLMWFTNSSPLGPSDIATRWRLVAQGILGGLFLWLINESVERLPIGDSTAIFFSGPVFTMILSTCMLRDHCGLYRTAIGIVLMSGILVISRPPGIFPPDLIPSLELELLNTGGTNLTMNPTTLAPLTDELETSGHKMVGIGVALLVPIFSAFLAILTRQLRHVHYSVLVFWFAVGGQVISTIFVITLDAKQTFSEWDLRTWLLCFFQSVIGIIGAMLMTKAVCWVTPAKTMVIRSLQIIVAYAIQVFAFGTTPHLADLAGAACIMAAVFAMFAEDAVMAKVPWRFL